MSVGDWEPAFLAVSAALGEPLDAALQSLGDEGTERAGDLVHSLRSESREVRVRAIAATVARVAIAIEATKLK